MRRALVGIPLISAGIGVFLLLWHAALGPSPKIRERARTPDPVSSRDSLPNAGNPPPRPDPIPPPAAPNRGSLKLFAHASGQGQANVRFFLDGGGTNAPPLSFVSRPDGTCTVPDLAPGEWIVTARHPKFIPSEARVRVEPGNALEFAIELREGGRAWGRVTGSDGRPLPRTLVTVLRGDTRTALAPPLHARADDDGRYLIEGIPLLDLALQFRSDRHKPLVKEGILFRYPGDSHEVDASLEEGAIVSGRVVDQAGAPLPGAQVTAGNEAASAARTDEEGRFTVYGLGDGDVNLSASARGHGTVYLRGVRPGATGLEIRLLKAGALGGRASAPGPLPAFVVILSRLDADLGREIRVQSKSFPASATGEFHLQDVAPGVYRVEIEAEGLVTEERPQVVVHPGQAATGVRVPLRKRE